MSPIVNAAAAALRRADIRFLRDEESSGLVVPWNLGNDVRLLIGIHADEDARDATIETVLCPVPASKQAPVALVMATLNARYKFVVFSLNDGHAGADVCVQVLCAEHAEAQLAIAFFRFVRVLERAHSEILAAVQRRSRTASRVERDIGAVLDDLNF